MTRHIKVRGFVPSVLLPFIAIVISIGALLFAVLSEGRRRECEFRFTTYDRLTELARFIDRQEENLDNFDAKIEVLGSKSDTFGSKSEAVIDKHAEEDFLNEADNLLNETTNLVEEAQSINEELRQVFEGFMANTIETIRYSRREMELHRLVFSDDALNVVSITAREAEDLFRSEFRSFDVYLAEKPQAKKYLRAADDYWTLVNALVDSALNSVAERIREICA